MKLLLFTCLFSMSLSQAQVGINTNDPKQPFHIDSKGNSATTADNRYVDDFVITEQGDVGVGTLTPSAKLEVNGITKINNLPISGYNNFKASKTLVADENGTIGAVDILPQYDGYGITDMQGYQPANIGSSRCSYKQIVDGACNLNICSVPSSTEFLPIYTLKFKKKSENSKKFIYFTIDFSIRTASINNVVLVRGYWLDYNLDVIINDVLVRTYFLSYNLPTGGPTVKNEFKLCLIDLEKTKLVESNTLKIRLRPTSSLMSYNAGTSSGNFNITEENFFTMRVNDLSFLLYES